MKIATENDGKKKDKSRDVCEAPSVALPLTLHFLIPNPEL